MRNNNKSTVDRALFSSLALQVCSLLDVMNNKMLSPVCFPIVISPAEGTYHTQRRWEETLGPCLGKWWQRWYHFMQILILDRGAQRGMLWERDVKTNKLIWVMITQCPLVKCWVGPFEEGGVGSFEWLPCWYFSHQPTTIKILRIIVDISWRFQRIKLMTLTSESRTKSYLLK